MCYPDVITNVQYNLPVINIVFSNAEYAFIKNKYEDMNAVMKEAVELNKAGRTIVIDARITHDRPIPVEAPMMTLDPKRFSEQEIADFKAKYEAEELVPFREFLEAEGLESRYIT